MTFTKGPSVNFTYEEVKDLVLQLEDSDKLRLAKELKKAKVPYDWDTIFALLKPRQVPDKEILKVGKKLRAKLQSEHRREAAAGRR